MATCTHPEVEEHDGETYCIRCGLLIRVPSTAAQEVSLLGTQDQQDTSFLLTETGRQRVDRRGKPISTNLPPRIRGRSAASLRDRMDGRVRRGERAHRAIRQLAQSLGIGPGRIQERAKYLLEKVQQTVPRTHLRPSLVAAAMYAASREGHDSLSLRRVAQTSGCTVGLVGKTYMRTRGILGLPASLIDPILFIRDHLAQILSVLREDKD
ncbi:hypothetical protein BJ684DRAFT_18024, partial [Piptocephalis cylindrospora]